jgi:YidC/Oxa1 family membrane protein insertase
MNQTRLFLFAAWAMAAILLWVEWGRFNAPVSEAVAPQATVTTAAAPLADSVPQATALQAAVGSMVPDASTVPAATPAITPAMQVAPAADMVTVTTDVLRVRVNGGNVFQAELLKYPQSKTAGSAPVQLFADDAEHFYLAQSGWTNTTGNAPTHVAGFVPEQGSSFALADGANEVVVPFVWNGPDGVVIRRTYTFKRGDYAISVRDEVGNAGSEAWQGQVYRQLSRVPPQIQTGMTNPESFSFRGAAYYDGGYNRRPFMDSWMQGKYLEDGKNDIEAAGGWIAMLQHHFFSAWIPSADGKNDIQLRKQPQGAATLFNITQISKPLSVPPGGNLVSEARLWVGPKLIEQMQAQQVPGLERAVDYSQFKMFAVIAAGLFWVLSHLHALLGNWGWSIIGLVVLLKAALFKLSAAQYKSAAKMRKFQPRMKQLQERYGEDKAKYQQALMELYKKEKINPMAGCLPVIPQMIIFMALYWMLAETVELRQAPWMLWIQDLTARDPYFILPILNMAIMWYTQQLTPMTGMDPTQQKMMKFMPLGFGVILAFLPAGLVLYQVANGGLGLLQQWYMLRKFGDAAQK